MIPKKYRCIECDALIKGYVSYVLYPLCKKCKGDKPERQTRSLSPDQWMGSRAEAKADREYKEYQGVTGKGVNW